MNILKERKLLYHKIENYYSNLLKVTKFSYTISDAAIIDYLERIEFVPVSEAMYKISVVLETNKDRIKDTAPVEIGGIIYLISEGIVKEVTSLTIPLFHKLRYVNRISRYPYIITPHAILRYLERVNFTNISNCRYNIYNDISFFFKNSNTQFINTDKLSSWQIKTNKYTLSLKGNVIITIY